MNDPVSPESAPVQVALSSRETADTTTEFAGQVQVAVQPELEQESVWIEAAAPGGLKDDVAEPSVCSIVLPANASVGISRSMIIVDRISSLPEKRRSRLCAPETYPRSFLCSPQNRPQLPCTCR